MFEAGEGEFLSLMGKGNLDLLIGAGINVLDFDGEVADIVVFGVGDPE